MNLRWFVVAVVMQFAFSAMAQWQGLDGVFGMTGKVNTDVV